MTAPRVLVIRDLDELVVRAVARPLSRWTLLLRFTPSGNRVADTQAVISGLPWIRDLPHTVRAAVVAALLDQGWAVAVLRDAGTAARFAFAVGTGVTVTRFSPDGAPGAPVSLRGAGAARDGKSRAFAEIRRGPHPGSRAR
jgi:hypothetical protein